jgi:hypothetical protein
MSSETAEEDFQSACRGLETAALKAAQEHAADKRDHRCVKHLLGWPAILSGGFASASAILISSEVAAVAALVSTILVTARTFQLPAEKEADHQARQADSEHVARCATHLRIVPPGDVPLVERLEKLDSLSRDLRDIRRNAPPRN